MLAKDPDLKRVLDLYNFEALPSIEDEFKQLVESYEDLVEGTGKEFEEKIVFTYRNLKEGV